MPGKHTILVVDDNRDKREAMVEYVIALGYEPMEAENGLEGLVLARQTQPDLILLDMMMPVMDGLEFLGERRRDNLLRNIPVIVITGQDSSSNTVVECIERGADDYLTMPPEFAVLQARVTSSLERRIQHREESRLRNRLESLVVQVKQAEKKANELLHAIFPRSKVEELKSSNEIKPERRENVAVMFCDVVGFTDYCDDHEPEEVVVPLQSLVESLESIAESHGLEKVKTIGDAFMAAAGLLEDDTDAALHCVACGLEMIQAAKSPPVSWDLRGGVHIGPVVAGKIGKKKFAYDLWGATVNIASRVEAVAQPGAMLVTSDVWQRLRDRCRGESQGVFDLKGVGKLELYRVDSMK